MTVQVRSPVALTAEQRGMLDGDRGPAVALAMRVVLAVARAVGAPRLRPIDSAHVDGCLYHGRAGLDFARRLVDLGGRVTVRTTLNVASLDLVHSELVRADPDLRAAGHALMDAYVALGCEQTWTCAPYQISHRPGVGTHVAWAESNAIAFVNSVLGARTDRYGDFIDIAAAITGVVPDAGLHTDAARRANVLLDCSAVPAPVWESEAAWAALGALLGDTAGTRVAALTGLPGDLSDGGLTEDRLKAVAATAASAGGVALFHVVGVTPEAPDLEAVLVPGGAVTTIRITAATLGAARDRLTTATGQALDAISLGTPHFSVSEFARLAAVLGAGPPFHPDVDVYVCTSRAVLAEAERLGYVEPLRAAGGRVVTDTCTYVTPVLDPADRVVMTNSGKWAWYAPGNLGVDVVLGSLADCVASARQGRVVRDERSWATPDSSLPATADASPTADPPFSPSPPPDSPQRLPTAPHTFGADQGKWRGSGEVTGRGSGGMAGRGSSEEIPCTVLHPGDAAGELLVLDAPLSFWGGVDPGDTVIDRHHPQYGISLTGRVVAMESGRGSSSSSSVLAEQIRAGTAPAAILLAEADAIVVLGAVVADEIYRIAMPVLQVPPDDLARLPRGGTASIAAARKGNDMDDAAPILAVTTP